MQAQDLHMCLQKQEGRVVNAIAQTAFVQCDGTTHVYFECVTKIAICFQSTLIGFLKNQFYKIILIWQNFNNFETNLRK